MASWLNDSDTLLDRIKALAALEAIEGAVSDIEYTQAQHDASETADEVDEDEDPDGHNRASGYDEGFEDGYAAAYEEALDAVRSILESIQADLARNASNLGIPAPEAEPVATP